MTESSAKPVAVVTGASSGIGRITSRTLLANGYRVTLVGRRKDALEETAGDAAAEDVLVSPGDVTREADVDGAFEATVERFGRVDVLFNNAGIPSPAVPFPDTDLEEWEKSLKTNLTGSFLSARAAFRVMAAQSPGGGRIINNGSLSAQSPRPHAVPYNATKSAITGLTKSISVEGRPHRIACGQIDIGNAKTEMTGGLTQGDGALQADGSRMREPTFDATHVGSAVLYMASLPLDANVQFITIMATNMPLVGRG